MATQMQVLIAPTGQRLQTDLSQVTSLDDFKAWVSNQSGIPAHNIVALTSQGKTVKIQTIQSEREIFIYDIRITQVSSPGASTALTSEFPIPKRYNPSAPPNSINDTHSLPSWQTLFKSRRDWALVVVEDCTVMASAIKDRHSEMDVMLKCLDAAVANLDTALKPIEPKFIELKKWATPTQRDYEMLANNWESYLELARSIDISPAMVRYMTGRDMRKVRSATLEDLVDPETTRKAGKLAATALRKFSAKITDLEKNADKMFRNCDELFQNFDKLLARSVIQQADSCQELLSDIEAVAKKIDTDYQATLQYSNQTRDVSQASKTAQNHTRQLLPSLQKRAAEMDDMLQYVTKSRNSIAADSLAFMRNIAEITSLHSTVKNQMNVLNQGEEEMTTFDYLRLIQQLPFMYASFVAEAVRRREWGEKVKTDSSTLVNEMALFQDEELKRRRKWQKMVGSTYGPDKVESNVPGLEVNLMGEEDIWPSMTRQDLEDFLSTIQRHKADSSVIDDVSKLIEELRAPTKQQSKRLKAFKNGSMHEAALGKSGLMIRGDDDLLRSLQDDKSKLEGKLKTAESRVRRLEDLLHRQSQASRPSIGNIFQPQDKDSLASLKSPRLGPEKRSSIDGVDTFIQRIAKLEAELSTEKERSAALEKEATARTSAMQGRMDEANSTKKDLLGNMEALKKEFMEERRSLEEEIRQLKAHIEETEDEIQHYGESRENEKMTFDERFSALTADVERLNREKRDEALKTQGQVDFLRNEARVERERNVSLERQLQEARETIRTLNKRCQTSEESVEAHAQSLKDLHGQLSPQTPVPTDLADLMESVASKSNDVLGKVQSLEQDISLINADLELARGQVKDTKAELSTTRDKLAKTEMDFVRLRENMDEEKARCATLEAEVKDTRDQLNTLRTRMTEGETGSESLRKQLSDEEQKVADLTEQLASRQSHVGSLDEEVRMYQEKLQLSESRLSAISSRYEERNGRTKELTQRLYTQNERLIRLLERLSFSVSRKDGTMVIQKIPRAERTSHNPNDSSDPNSSSIRRSISVVNNNPLADSADLKLLYWMNAEDAQLESDQYQAYINGPGNFDVDAFSDAVYRRIKEVEHTARKMTREARAYRERAHNSAKDAHDKIAFRHFKEGDLALFLPTRNQTTGAWAAFNVGCPHFFLREQESHRLRSREWLVARITRVQERVVDLSKSLQSTGANASEAETDSMNTTDEFDNPFDLSDGLRWWLIDAQEDKPGAPTTPGLGKSTVAANTVAAVADMQGTRAGKSKSKLGRSSGIEDLSKTLSKSLDSRRSSTGSKKTTPFAVGANAPAKGSAVASETNSLRAAPADSPLSGTSPRATAGRHEEATTSSAQAASSLTTGGETSGSHKRKERPGTGNKEDKELEGNPPSLSKSSSPAKAGSSYMSSMHAGMVQHHQDHHQQQSEPGPSSAPSQRPPQRRLERDLSTVSETSVESPSKKSVVWDSLWNLDLSYPAK